MSVDLLSLQDKIYESLRPSGWHDPLKSFLLSDEMTKLLLYLREQSEDGVHWTPKLKQVFRAFTECPYEKLKLVIILQSPYQFLEGRLTVADGIAMSCGNTMKLQPSLKLFGDEVRSSLSLGKDYLIPCDLKIWANQGVLLLNIALTTTVGKTDSHYKLWRPFIVFLLDMLSWTNGGLIYAFLGLKAKEYDSIVGNNNYKLYASHPASASHAGSTVWDSKGLFPRIQELLLKNNKEEIKW